MSDKAGAVVSIGFTQALFITFLVLKLTKVIDWSWWWVTAPLWVPVAFAILFVTVGVIVIMIMNAFALKEPKR